MFFDFNDKVEILKGMNDYLNDFKYGIPINGKLQLINGPEDFKYYKYYKYLSPKEFEYFKCGLCWDYIEYQKQYLLKRHIECKNYHIIDNNNVMISHDITIARINGKYYYAESSLKDICGIYESNNILDIFKYVAKQMKIASYSVYEINTNIPYGCDGKTYTDIINNNCKFICTDKISKNDKIIKCIK